MADYIDIHSHKKINNTSSVFTIFNVLLPANTTPINTFFSTGCHPWDVKKTTPNLIEEQLNSLIKNEQLIAIGEIGLDRHIETDIEIQKEAFEIQLNIAIKSNKPAIIHCVRAYSDLMNIVKTRRIETPMILHDYNGNRVQTEKLLTFKCYFSFGKSLFQDRPKLNEIFREIPLNRLFLETDDSEVTIESVYSKAAEIRSIPLSQLITQEKQNFVEIFGAEILNRR